MLYCHITSQVEGDPYQDLKGKRDTGGFPGLVFLDANGDLLTEHNDNRDVASFRLYADLLIPLNKHQLALAGGDTTAAIEVLKGRMQLGMIPVAEAEARRAELTGLPAVEAKAVDGLLRDLRLIHLARGITQKRQDPAAIVREMLELTAVNGDPGTIIAQREYWPIVASHAVTAKEKKLLAKAIKATQKAYGKSLDADWLREHEKALKKM